MVKLTERMRRLWRKEWGVGVFVGVALLGVLMCSYGYAAFSTDLLISGEAIIRAESEIRNDAVALKSATGGGVEGYNSQYTVHTASVYPQIPQVGGEVVYTIQTCNHTTNKSFELTKIAYPIASVGGMNYGLQKIEAGTDLVVGTVVGPGECVESEVSFVQTAASSTVGALTVDFEWTLYNPVKFTSTYMQDFTVAECNAVSARETTQMIDRRDGKKYWVGKLKDGHCWMTQNLAYNGGGEAYTASTISGWNMSNYVNDPSYFVVNDNAKGHESDGNYYSYGAINNHADPVCPANWRVPTGTDFDTLHGSLGGNASSLYNIVSKAPFYYRMDGWVSTSGISDTGTSGYLRAISVNTTTDRAATVVYIWPNDVSNHYDTLTWGASVRCIADDIPPTYPTQIQDITTMQEMTAAICQNSLVGDAKELIDTRDNKKYWVTKLVDRKCWMTQNLDYDGGGTSVANLTNWQDNNAVAQYHYMNSNSMGHSSRGSYYSWGAAMNVCPTNWRLPTGGSAGEIYHLTNYYNTSTNPLTFDRLTSAPYYINLPGWTGLGNGNVLGLYDINTYGAIWSSTQTPTNANRVYILELTNNYFSAGEQTVKVGIGESAKRYGYAVRCLYGGL